MTPAELGGWLKGKGGWLSVPGLVGNLGGAALAGYYGVLTLDLAAEERTTFVSALVMVTGLVAAISNVLALRRIRTLRGLESGRLKVDAEAALKAVIELHPYPDYLGVQSVVAWVIATTSVAAITWAFTTIGVPQLLRILSLGLLFGPIAAGLSTLLSMRRTRVIIEQLSTILEATRVIDAMPAERLRVRGRVIGFTAILVVVPALMLVDASMHLSGIAFAKFALVDNPADQLLALDDARMLLYGRLTVLCVLVLGAAALFAWAGGTVMFDPMTRVADEANRMARGELRTPVVIHASDEVWAVTSSFTRMQAQLLKLLNQLSSAGASIATTTEQLLATGNRYEAGAAEQAASLNETSATTEELATSARQISHNATEVSVVAQRTLDAATQGQASADAFTRAIDRMRQDNRSIAESVTRLSRRVQQIGKVVEVITQVADRSDLLALSAELEGTKAGDVGRGFSLVAAEMRRLAENVLESTSEIEVVIGEIREATQATVLATEKGLEQTTSGTALAGQVSQALLEVVDLANQTTEAVRTISLATQQQQTGTDQLAEAMADILGITQQSLAATRQLTGANNELSALSTSLSSLVERFTLSEQARR